MAFCPVEGTRLIECRNDLRFHILGPILSEQRRWGSVDETGYAAVTRDAPQWWLDEVAAESEADHGQGCTLASHPPDERTCAEIDQERSRLGVRREHDTITPAERAQLERLESLGTFIVPDDCWGTYPSDRYQVMWSSRELIKWSAEGLVQPSSMVNFDGWSNNFLSVAALLLFSLGRLAIQVTLWSVGQAFTFDIGEYRDTIIRFTRDLDQELVHFAGHDFTLVTVTWFGLFAGAAFIALRGKIGRAAAEVALTILLVAMAFPVLGSVFEPLPDDPGSDTPAYQVGGHMDSVVRLVDQSSRAPLLVGHGRSPNEVLDRDEVRGLLRDTQGFLHKEFVERPHMAINWGKQELEGTCAEVHDNLLTVPTRISGWPQRYMERQGCLDEAGFNGNMDMGRFLSTLLVSVVATLVAVVIGMAAFMLLIAKFLTALMFVALPLAVVVAILPGRGRQMAWWWLGTLVQLWLAALGMGLVILVLLFGLDVVETTLSGLAIADRWLTVLFIVLVIYLLRKRIVAGSQNVAGAISQRLAATTTAGLPGKGGGLDLLSTERSASRAGFAATAGAFMVGKLGAGLVVFGAGMVLRPAAWLVSGALLRLPKRRLFEGRYHQKLQAWRGAMNDWEFMLERRLGLHGANLPALHLGSGGRATIHKPPPTHGQIAGRRANVPVVRLLRAARAGNVHPWTGVRPGEAGWLEMRGLLFKRNLLLRRADRVVGPDGRSYKLHPPKRGPVPSDVRRMGRAHNEHVITNDARWLAGGRPMGGNHVSPEHITNQAWLRAAGHRPGAGGIHGGPLQAPGGPGSPARYVGRQGTGGGVHRDHGSTGSQTGQHDLGTAWKSGKGPGSDEAYLRAFRDLNPKYFRDSCGAHAIAVHSMLEGRPMIPARGGVRTVDGREHRFGARDLEAHFGRQFYEVGFGRPGSAKKHVEDIMKKSGPGTQGVLYMTPRTPADSFFIPMETLKHGAVREAEVRHGEGHVVNVLHDGKVRFIDAGNNLTTSQMVTHGMLTSDQSVHYELLVIQGEKSLADSPPRRLPSLSGWENPSRRPTPPEGSRRDPSGDSYTGRHRQKE